MSTNKHGKQKRHFGIWVLLFGLLVIAAALFGGYHYFNSTRTPALPREVKLTAVGDSLTQGVGDPTGKGGYTHLIAKKVNHKNPNVKMSMVNYGISGETTNQINYRVVHSKRLQHSLRTANVITITTGGNDLLKFLKANVMSTNQKTLNQRSLKYAVNYQSRVTRLFRNIRHLNRQASIFVFGIYNPVYVYFPQVAYINETVAKTNQITNQVIHQQHGMYFVSINKQLTDGQFKTVHSRKVLKKKATDSFTQGSNHSAADIDRLLDGQSSQSNKYLSNNDHFHPNLTGYKIMTNLLYKQMAQHITWIKE